MGGSVDAKDASSVSLIYDDGSVDLGARDIKQEGNGLPHVNDGDFGFWGQMRRRLPRIF